MNLVNRSWTVQELINRLSQLPPHHEVRLDVSYGTGVDSTEASKFEFDISTLDNIVYLTNEAMSP